MMTAWIIKTPLFAAAIIAMAGCTEQNVTAAQTGTNELKDGDYCFTQTFSNGDVTDVQELKFNVSGSKAAGEYNWLPQFKDRRLGKFGGTVAGSTITANYEFSQEGANTSTPITIVVEDTKAIIEGGAPELGLGATISKVECTQ